MASVIPNGYARVSYLMTLAGDPEPMICTFGLKLDGPANLAMAEDLLSEWATAFDGMANANITFSGVRLEVGTSSGDPVIYEASGTAQGAVSGNMLPNNCAYLLKKQTALGGRKNRGRCFLPFATEGNCNDRGEISSGDVAILTGIAQDWQVATVAIDGIEELVILHSDSTTPTVITNVVIDGKIATQRRRLRP